MANRFLADGKDGISVVRKMSAIAEVETEINQDGTKLRVQLQWPTQDAIGQPIAHVQDGEEYTTADGSFLHVMSVQTQEQGTIEAHTYSLKAASRAAVRNIWQESTEHLVGTYFGEQLRNKVLGVIDSLPGLGDTETNSLDYADTWNPSYSSIEICESCLICRTTFPLFLYPPTHSCASSEA